MASQISLPSIQGPVLRSKFLGKHHSLAPPFPTLKQTSRFRLKLSAKFDVFQLLGGRGLCNGEKGVEQELRKNVDPPSQPSLAAVGQEDSSSAKTIESIQEDGFEKELMGLTGGFPGGEKGLKKFIEENPPPRKSAAAAESAVASSEKPKPPELPVLMPGMIAIVSNPNNPYYMYCGIVQRITDGKAGVLFEGGNWDRLITFRLEELQRREKGPPMKSPRSCILEAMLENSSN